MQLVIICGGLATRLRPVTKKIPKSMIMFKDKPFLWYQLELVKKYGIRLLPDLYEYLNPIYSREEALEMEKRLAAELSGGKGYRVFGGH